MTISDDVLEPVQVAAQAAADKRGRNIVAFDVSEQLSITDVFLIASADNERLEMNPATGAVPMRSP